MSQLYIYNSLTGRQELFRTKDNKVGLYVCGITPYDVTHLGHAFTYVFFDLVVRYLKYLGYRVTYVQNLTDIDDDLLKKARARGENWRRLVKANTALFLNDMAWLNNLPPDFYPRASDHTGEMIELIKKLLKKRLAYYKKGNVYFSVQADADFGKLSKLPAVRMLPLANQRGNNPHDPDKEQPLDFVLWQKRQPGEPAWPSPWGPGRPGWHIECSAMSSKYLGPAIDIQGGGADLIFPHHECTIAQLEPLSGRQFVNYWLHTAMLRYRGVKMSKSLGNLVLIGDLKKHYSANEVRLSLLNHHYRQVWNWRKQDLVKARAASRLFNKIWQLPSAPAPELEVERFRQGFFNSLNSDFDTARAINWLIRLSQRSLKLAGSKNINPVKILLSQAFQILGLARQG